VAGVGDRGVGAAATFNFFNKDRVKRRTETGPWYHSNTKDIALQASIFALFMR
jgi:hypothetical protein